MTAQRNRGVASIEPQLLPIMDIALSPDVYRDIFAKLDLPTNRPSVIGVSSAISGEGRTTISLGLAQMLARDSDLPVLLVDADLDHPALAAHFDLPPSPGLAEVLRGQAAFGDVMRPVAENLFLVTAARTGDDAGRLLNRLAQSNPFHAARRPPAMAVLDLPPILDRGYGSVAAQVADVLVLVVRAGITPVELVREAIARLGDRPPHGVILNGPRSALPGWWPRGSE